MMLLRKDATSSLNPSQGSSKKCFIRASIASIRAQISFLPSN